MTTLKNTSFLGVLEQTCETKEQKIECLTHVFQSIDKDIQIQLLINLIDKCPCLQRKYTTTTNNIVIPLIQELLTMNDIYSSISGHYSNRLHLFTDNSDYCLESNAEIGKFIGKISDCFPRMLHNLDQIFKWVELANQHRKQKLEEEKEKEEEEI